MGSATSTTAYAAATEGQLGLVDGPIVRTFSQVGRTTTPGAGEIGEYVEASCTSTTSAETADTYTDVTGMSITLSPGIWLIGYDVAVGLEWVAGTSVFVIGTAAITDSSNTVIDATVAYSQIKASSSDDNIWAAVSRKTRIVVATETTYKLRCRIRDTNGRYTIAPSSVVTGLTNPDNSSNIWALRIA